MYVLRNAFGSLMVEIHNNKIDLSFTFKISTEKRY